MLPICARIEMLEPEYKSSFDPKLYPDFVIESRDGDSYQCHRLMLATRSSVFRTMFQSEMKETKERRMKLDFSSFIVDNFIGFLYGRDIESDVLLANDKFYLDLAEAYNIELLKLKTEKILIEVLSQDNMVDLYVISDLYNASYLNEEAKKFMVLNKDSLKNIDLKKQLKSVSQTKILEIMQMIL